MCEVHLIFLLLKFLSKHKHDVLSTSERKNAEMQKVLLVMHVVMKSPRPQTEHKD